MGDLLDLTVSFLTIYSIRFDMTATLVKVERAGHQSRLKRVVYPRAIKPKREEVPPIKAEPEQRPPNQVKTICPPALNGHSDRRSEEISHREEPVAGPQESSSDQD